VKGKGNYRLVKRKRGSRGSSGVLISREAQKQRSTEKHSRSTEKQRSREVGKQRSREAGDT
jgi:hypothetical protein